MKQKKKISAILAALFLVTATNLVCAAEIPTKVVLSQNLAITYNGDVQRFKNVNGEIVYPISYEGTTYLPIRSISCLFETGIEWNGDINSIYLGKGNLDKTSAVSLLNFDYGTDQTITADINQDIKIYYNDELQTFKDVNGKVVYPLSYQGTTYLPVRAISNLYKADIEWDGETSTVAIKTKEEDNTLKKDDFKITGYSNFNGKENYSVIPSQGIEYKETDGVITIEYPYFNPKKFNLPSNLNDYSEEICFRMTYSEPNYNFKSCRVFNRVTGEEIKDLTEENIKKLFDIEYEKTIIEKPITEKIYLSELSQEEIYKYVLTEEISEYQLINDLGEDCIIYRLENNSPFGYDKKLCNQFESAMHFSEAGCSFKIMYRKTTPKEVLGLLSEDDVVYLSEYSAGEEISVTFKEYVYNDTTNMLMIDLNYKNKIETYELKPNQGMGFSWVYTDSMTIK